MSAPRHIDEILKEKQSFCIAPWVNASIDTNGSFRPCCKFSQPHETKSKLGDLLHSNVPEIWNSDSMQTLRQSFIDGEKPEPCKSCWNEEKSGFASLRKSFLSEKLDLDEVSSLIDFDSTKSDFIMTLDLKLSNKCNLKCRICSEVASSTYLEEAKRIPLRDVTEQEKQLYRSKKIFMDGVSAEWLQRTLRYVRHVELFGGEPLLVEENRQLEDHLISSGISDKINIVYNTNATLYSEDLVRKFAKFKSVQVNFSIDDIESRFEYQRAPAKWQTVLANIQKYRKNAPANTSFNLSPTVSIFNVYYLPELILKVKSELTGLFVSFNMLHSELHYNISFLHHLAKDAVRKKLLTFAEFLNEPEYSSQLYSVLKFLDQNNYDLNIHHRLLYEIEVRDRLRNADFFQVFPDFATLIYNSKPRA